MKLHLALRNAAKFRTVFDFGEREVAHWFPGHMAKGLLTRSSYWTVGTSSCFIIICIMYVMMFGKMKMFNTWLSDCVHMEKAS